MNKKRYKPRIAKLRDDAGLTQKDLAEKVGVTETTIANWESGRRGLEWMVRFKNLCEALKCEIEELIEEDKTDELSQEEFLARYGGELFGKYKDGKLPEFSPQNDQ